MSMRPLGAFLGERYAEICSNPYFGHKTPLDGYAKELFSWLDKAASMVLFQAEVGGNAYCYYGTTGNEGIQALKNARQFLRWAATSLRLDGAPQ